MIFFLQDMATFKIASLQKALDDSVPSTDLDLMNKRYHDLTEKYRDTLEKGNTLVSKAEALVGLEVGTRWCQGKRGGGGTVGVSHV